MRATYTSPFAATARCRAVPRLSAATSAQKPAGRVSPPLFASQGGASAASTGSVCAPATTKTPSVKRVIKFSYCRSLLLQSALLLLTDNLELLNPPAAVFGDIHIALRIHRDAVWLVEFTGEVPGAAETRQNLAALSLNDFDARVVLVDEIHEPLVRIVRQIER